MTSKAEELVEPEDVPVAPVPAVVRACGDLLAEPYPQDVFFFGDLSGEEIKRLVDAMVATGIPAPSDRLHAGWARRLAARLQAPNENDLEWIAERAGSFGP